MKREEAKGLAKTAGVIFIIVGILVVIKGFLDIFILYPTSEFVTLDNWRRYSIFEVVYGVACIGVGLVIFEFVKIYLENSKPR